MALAIGFATEFYTLWDITVEKVYGGNVVMNGVGPNVIGYNTKYGYIKNISKDREKAIDAYPGIEIDEDLRGRSRSWEKFDKVDYPVDCFSFGQLSGVKISEATDVWQICRAMTNEKGARRRASARRRLIELGELVRYPHTETKRINVNWAKRDESGNCLEDDYQDVEYRVSYATPKFVEIAEAKKKQSAQDYLFNDGEKVSLSIKEVGRFGFQSTYGYTSIRVYETSEGKTVKYMGSNPIDLPDGFTTIKATIKHKEYRGNKETHLLRMKTA